LGWSPRWDPAALVARVRRGRGWGWGEIVEDARVFDGYEGAQVAGGDELLAVNVRMRAADQTLGADEVGDADWLDCRGVG
jgi:phenylalanyl-tRNA synthetase beta subunit